MRLKKWFRGIVHTYPWGFDIWLPFGWITVDYKGTRWAKPHGIWFSPDHSVTHRWTIWLWKQRKGGATR